MQKDSHHRPLISFDWAIKRMLRQKANFFILEGFLTELLGYGVTIRQLLESETNAQQADDKITRVDMLCETTTGELIIIELQYNNEWDYLQRMLFGASKIITEYIAHGEPYGKVRKVFSINIVYFDLGQGVDYVYHGTTSFSGRKIGDTLQLSVSQRNNSGKQAVTEIFPEYFIIKVNNFDDVATDTLDEWIYYLKNSNLPQTFRAKGLSGVEVQLKRDNMSKQEQQDYELFLEKLTVTQESLEATRMDAMEKGDNRRARSAAAKLVLRGFINADIADITGLSMDEIEEIRRGLN